MPALQLLCHKFAISVKSREELNGAEPLSLDNDTVRFSVVLDASDKSMKETSPRPTTVGRGLVRGSFWK